MKEKEVLDWIKKTINKVGTKCNKRTDLPPTPDPTAPVPTTTTTTTTTTSTKTLVTDDTGSTVGSQGPDSPDIDNTQGQVSASAVSSTVTLTVTVFMIVNIIY